jgi:general secretion pathway protein G
MTTVRDPRHCRATKGFTLIELVVTLFILGILASAAFPLTQLAFRRHKEEQLRHSLSTIRDAIDAYKKASAEGHIAIGPLDSGYPPNLAILVTGVVDATSATGRRIYFLRRVPGDPMSDDDGESGEASWGKRSYESDADNPREGADIYDIYSQSSEVGLNGISYREW